MFRVMKDVLLPKPICIHALLNHRRLCVFLLVVVMSGGLEGAGEKK